MDWKESDPRSVVLVGGGGHAMVVAEAAIAAGRPLAGFIDDNAEADLAGLARRIGGMACLEHEAMVRDHPTILCMGDLRVRAGLIPRMDGPLATVVHPSAVIAESAEIGAGVFIGPRVVVHSRARIGAHAIINTGAIIEHDCEIGMNSHVAPGCALGGNVRIGADTLVGIGSCVIPGVAIGRGCVVGAGAAVAQDVEDGALVVGVPAREIER